MVKGRRSNLPLRKFMRDNRVEIDRCIDAALNVKPLS